MRRSWWIDNEIAKDKFQISLLQMACPAGVKCFICDEDKAVELLKSMRSGRFSWW